MLDVLIKNANIIDGTGKPAYKGSIGISGGKLVMADGSEEATAVIDASGKYVSPGWIDAHSHGDLILGSEDAHLFKTTQGVTTELTGQCGLSMAPVMPENLAAVQNMLSMGTTWFPDDMKNWSSFARFLDYADQQKLTANAKMYIGHSSLRIAVMGMANRPATDAELDRMKGILREAMEDGAAGFSTGLIYTPSCYAEEKEIIELAKVIALFIAMLVTGYVLHPYMPEKTVMQYIDAYADRTGNVLLIVGAGGCFASMLGATTMSTDLVAIMSATKMPVILLGFLLAFCIRAAVGSATAAMLTSIAIAGPVCLASGMSPIIAGLSVCLGANAATFPTDVTFWFPSTYNGLDTKDCLATTTIPCILSGAIGMVILVVLNAFSGVLPGMF